MGQARSRSTPLLRLYPTPELIEQRVRILFGYIGLNIYQEEQDFLTDPYVIEAFKLLEIIFGATATELGYNPLRLRSTVQAFIFTTLFDDDFPTSRTRMNTLLYSIRLFVMTNRFPLLKEYVATHAIRQINELDRARVNRLTLRSKFFNNLALLLELYGHIGPQRDNQIENIIRGLTMHEFRILENTAGRGRAIQQFEENLIPEEVAFVINCGFEQYVEHPFADDLNIQQRIREELIAKGSLEDLIRFMKCIEREPRWRETFLFLFRRFGKSLRELNILDGCNYRYVLNVKELTLDQLNVGNGESNIAKIIHRKIRHELSRELVRVAKLRKGGRNAEINREVQRTFDILEGLKNCIRKGGLDASPEWQKVYDRATELIIFHKCLPGREYIPEGELTLQDRDQLRSCTFKYAGEGDEIAKKMYDKLVAVENPPPMYVRDKRTAREPQDVAERLAETYEEEDDDEMETALKRYGHVLSLLQKLKFRKPE